ncbi:MAG: hypothetical protein H0U27_08390 [Nitrosopumilus sp.]|nr:hypothetical protein [Nitrosopumilus sp.]
MMHTHSLGSSSWQKSDLQKSAFGQSHDPSKHNPPHVYDPPGVSAVLESKKSSKKPSSLSSPAVPLTRPPSVPLAPSPLPHSAPAQQVAPVPISSSVLAESTTHVASNR